MDSILIEGIPAYNGEYPLDISYFTNRELHLIKELSGVRAGELEEAFAAGDNDLMVAVAAIAIWRKTRVKPDLDAIWDAEAGKFTLRVAETVEDDDESVPPPIEPDAHATTGVGLGNAGSSSNGLSDRPESVLSRIGTPG
jgi:hypothetical protein